MGTHATVRYRSFHPASPLIVRRREGYYGTGFFAHCWPLFGFWPVPLVVHQKNKVMFFWCNWFSVGGYIHLKKVWEQDWPIHRFPHKFKYDLDRTVIVCLFESTNDWQESPDSPYALWCMCMHSLFLQTVQNIGTKVAPKKMTSADFPRNPQGFGIYCRLRSLYGRGDLANLANGKKLFTMFKSCWGSSPYVDV